MTFNAIDTTQPLTLSLMRKLMAQGYIACGRYIGGGGAWKQLKEAEVTAAGTAGFALWLIDEGTGDMAQFSGGEAAGHADGQRLSQAAAALGVPARTPVFVGVDFGADASSVSAIRSYMSGYQAGCVPYIAGLYADGLVAAAIPTAVGDFVPGASSWPGTAAYLKSGKVALIQGLTQPLLGLTVDMVQVVDPSVLWFPGKNGAAVTPPPVNGPTQGSTEIMPDLKAMQARLGVTADGIWGPNTAAAVAAYYEGQ